MLIPSWSGIVFIFLLDKNTHNSCLGFCSYEFKPVVVFAIPQGYTLVICWFQGTKDEVVEKLKQLVSNSNKSPHKSISGRDIKDASDGNQLLVCFIVY